MEKSTLFLRKKGLNHSFKLKGSDFDGTLLELLRDYEQIRGNMPITGVLGLLLSPYAKNKLEYINGHCIVRDFPNNQPTLEWAGAVLDLLEELKLGNYH